jgi:LacI family transcriptional regulator, gluconate utilization system Gnt-I transcriptional repressor
MPIAHKNSIRLKDVAELAGVNMMTVSRVVNQPEKVAVATRDKVLAAIKKTGYVPNLMAGSLATNKSRIVGCIVPTIDNSIFAETVRGLTEQLTLGGYQLLLGQSNYDTAVEDQLVATFLGRRVDGLVLTGGAHSAITVKRLKQAKVPVVETWDLPEKPIDMVAGFSNFEAGKAVGNYLLAQGHKMICFAGSMDERSSARLAGLQAAYEKKAVKPNAIRLAAGASFAGGRKVIADLVQTGLQENTPNAIFFGNDALAAGALMECLARGIKVPKQLAIMGFADLDIAANLEPALSTVRVLKRQMGQAAAGMLLARLNPASPTGKLPAKIQDLGFELVLRESA